MSVSGPVTVQLLWDQFGISFPFWIKQSTVRPHAARVTREHLKASTTGNGLPQHLHFPILTTSPSSWTRSPASQLSASLATSFLSSASGSSSAFTVLTPFAPEPSNVTRAIVVNPYFLGPI